MRVLYDCDSYGNSKLDNFFISKRIGLKFGDKVQCSKQIRHSKNWRANFREILSYKPKNFRDGIVNCVILQQKLIVPKHS